MNKISIRFYKDHKVRALWDEENNQWWFSDSNLYVTARIKTICPVLGMRDIPQLIG